MFIAIHARTDTESRPVHDHDGESQGAPAGARGEVNHTVRPEPRPRWTPKTGHYVVPNIMAVM